MMYKLNIMIIISHEIKKKKKKKVHSNKILQFNSDANNYKIQIKIHKLYLIDKRNTSSRGIDRRKKYGRIDKSEANAHKSERSRERP